jgi:putative hydrolase of the HAD superfamily
MKIMVFTEGTIFTHSDWIGLTREETSQRIQNGERPKYAGTVPIGNAAAKLRAWSDAGAEIVYLTSRRSPEEVELARQLLRRYGFPGGELFFCREGEEYRDAAERATPDVLVEDDCESIGGEVEMTYPHLRPGLKARIASIVVREFGGIDHLPEDPFDLLAAAKAPSGEDRRLRYRTVLFDWGDTVMRDNPVLTVPMVEWQTVEAVEGIAEVLAYLRSSGRQVILATSADISNEEQIRGALRRVDLAGYFARIYSFKNTGLPKGEAFYLHILSDLGIPAAEALMVGDHFAKDIQAANAVGIFAVWFNPRNGETHTDNLHVTAHPCSIYGHFSRFSITAAVPHESPSPNLIIVT